MHALHQVEEDDMFALDEPAAPAPMSAAGTHLQFEGRLQRHAEVRTRPAIDGVHSVPVVCLELCSIGPGVKRTCHVEKPFTDATRREAEALAKRLHKGAVVTVTAPVADMHVSFPHANSIDLYSEKSPS